MALRKWMVGLTSALVLGALGVAACGGDDSAGGSEDASTGDGGGSDATQGGDTSTAQDSGVDGAAAEIAACQAVVDAYCSQLSSCLPGFFTTSCAQARASCPNSIFGEGSTMTVDQANACAAQIASVSSCPEIQADFSGPINFYSSPPLRIFPACNAPGTRGQGDSCESNTQCASLFCASPESNWASAITANGLDGKCGTCAAVFGPDDDCTAGLPAYAGGSVCPIGQGCDSTTKRCHTINAGDPCISGLCAYGAACAANPDGGAIGICATEPPVGSQCIDAPFPCANGGYCVFGDDAHDDGGTCAAAVPTGGDCTNNARATPACATAGNFCFSLDGGAQKTCNALPRDGQPCLGGSTCDPFSAYCDERVVGRETCRSLAANGQPCGVFPQTFADGGPTGGTATVNCAGACSTTCATIPDSGVTGTCIGSMLGGQPNDSCGTDKCTTCAPGANCVSGKCETASLHCN